MAQIRVEWLAWLLALSAALCPGPAAAERRQATPAAGAARGWEASVPTSDPFAPADCDLAGAQRTSTITLGAAGVSTPCIVVSAGDVVTWVNPLDMPVAIQAGDDQLYSEDVSVALSSFEVPAQGSLRLRAIHAGRIDYAAPDRPGLGGTILVLGYESAA